ncbi:MAG: hypothetical protein V4858_28185 [Pseudomonadota bacterium]
MTPIELTRTFSPAADKQDDGDNWSDYFGLARGGLKWTDLQDKPLSVILGQAGIGKTVEFELEVQRLRGAGKAAFFIALNQLVNPNSWNRALGDSIDGYEQWKVSNDTAFFFLDAVDESRLKGQADFEQALSEVLLALGKCMSRVRFVISSRPTDWSIDGVRAAVEKYLAKPIATSLSALKQTAAAAIATGGTSVNVVRLPNANAIEPLVAFLEPLSISEAKRLADAFAVQDANAFWNAVSDGSYAFMATRPLDLGWMVRLWNEQRNLGTYLELIEFNIENRLTELNSNYIAVGAVLSLDRLREGSEELAAAAELSGRAYIATEYAPTTRKDEVAPTSVLSSWKPNEVTRLLAAAVFDEASFGRVQFHHRTTRAYLAACWVNRQLVIGVPLHRLLSLFVASPFGTSVLIPSRRWALCWLAAINVEVREWLTQNFPEMLLFDGDPQAWDSLTADRAFMAYVQRLMSGFKKDWNNDQSEFRRVGRALSPGLVAGLLATSGLPIRVTTSLLPIAKYGRLTDCAEVVFAIYKNVAASQRERRIALEVLETIATTKQREVVKVDLVSGLLTSNDLIAAALPTIDWQGLSIAQMAAIFMHTKSDGRYVAGALAQTVKDDLLPVADAPSTEMLLRAVLEALPKPGAGKRFARFSDSDQPDRAWLLEVLPDCFERLLTLIPRKHTSYPEICVEAAERLEALRDTGFVDREEFRRIHILIAEHPMLRWQIALEIAQSETIIHSTSRLTWGTNCLVSFEAADVPELILRANDTGTSLDVRNIWFTIGVEVTFRGLRGRNRINALTALAAGPDCEARMSRIHSQRANWVSGAIHRRESRAEDALQKRERQVQHDANRANFLTYVECIRDASHMGSLQWLMHYSYEHAGRTSFTRVNYEVILRDFGQTVAVALAVGLKVVWAAVDPPNPADSKDGVLPWEALTALAGLYTLLDEGMNIASLTDADVERAAKLAVWDFDGPPSWFEPLAIAHGSVVSKALRPWIESEALLRADSPHLRSVLEMVLRCSTAVRASLLAPLIPMLTDGRIGRAETLKELTKALRVGGLLSASALSNLCRSRVVTSISPEGLVRETYWLHTWLEVDPASAWVWFERHVAGTPGVAGEVVKAFAEMAQDCNWVKQPADAASIDVLLRLHGVLTQYQPSPGSPVEPKGARAFGQVVAELRSRIPEVLVRSRGTASHLALKQLMAAEVDPDSKQWLAAQVTEHAALEALELSLVEPHYLRAISSPFIAAPKNEAQLFIQVMARLEEVRKGTEEGPYSDRDLFSPGMPEPHLQSWLAARFSETKNRRFTVTREEQVDDDKEPDIQLGCPHGKVCVEIKPVDRERGYSANSLTETLRVQIVQQYLKGFNSNHGILVLFKLDNKTWNIPGGKSRQSFSALVEYLQSQADIIKSESPNVVALQVIGINCVI